MKIGNNISFGKTLVATCQIQTKDKQNCDCKIFELNNDDDSDYFLNLQKNPEWQGNRFVWVLDRLMQSKSIGNENDTFSIENETGNCLGYINVITHENPYNNKSIQYLEISPQLSISKKNKTGENLAKSLLSVIVRQAKKEDREKVSVLAFDSKTRKFFSRKCGFKHGSDSAFDFVLKKNDYSKFLVNNEQNRVIK